MAHRRRLVALLRRQAERARDPWSAGSRADRRRQRKQRALGADLKTCPSPGSRKGRPQPSHAPHSPRCSRPIPVFHRVPRTTYPGPSRVRSVRSRRIEPPSRQAAKERGSLGESRCPANHSREFQGKSEPEVASHARYILRTRAPQCDPNYLSSEVPFVAMGRSERLATWRSLPLTSSATPKAGTRWGVLIDHQQETNAPWFGRRDELMREGRS